jgi:cytochrome P450
MNKLTLSAAETPRHIPAHLIGDYPFVRGRISTERPHDIAQRIQDTETRAGWYVPALFADVGGWVFRHVADNKAIGANTEHFSNAAASPFGTMTGGSWRSVPNEMDPPEHGAYRAMLNPLFVPRKVAELDEKIRLYARAHVEAFREVGHCDFMTDFAYKFPINIFMELMGLPQERVGEFLEWERQLIHGEAYADIVSGARRSVDYLREEIAAHRAAPRNDIIGFLLRARAGGKDLSDDDLLGLCFNLFIGGLDTVTTHMGFFFRHLAENPQHQAELREHPDRMGDAVDELMRAYACSTNQKLCIKDIEVGGIQIRAGECAAVSGPLAGRDRAEYPDADLIRFDRRPRTISFGYGPHLCIGIHLAKRELRIAMETVLEMLPEFSVAPGVAIISRLGAIPQPTELPLVW